MADTNLYQDLKNALSDFETFLTANLAVITPAILALKPLIPQIETLITSLITLMGQLKTEIQGLNVGAIQGLDKVAQFTNAAKVLLTTAETLMPDQKASIDQALGTISVVTSLPTLDQVKGDIIQLLDQITAKLQTLA